jgi:hypothetical protein
MVKRLDQLGGNRFTGPVRENVGAARTPEAKGAPGETLRFTEAQFRQFAGRNNQVFAEALSPADGLNMLEAIKEIRTAPDFSVAFSDKILENPVLRELFTRWVQAARANVGGAAANPQKVNSGEYVYSRIEVETWLDSVKQAFEKMVALQKETPINMAEVGLEIIDRKAELLKLAAQPITLAPTLAQMATVPGLDDATKRHFYTQLASVATTHCRSVDKTPEDLKLGLQNLRTAIEGLVKTGETKKTVDNLVKEAQRIGKAIDGETGVGEQLRTAGLMLSTGDAKAGAWAKVEIDKLKGELLELRYESQSEQRHFTAQELDSFRAFVQIAAKSKDLLDQVPEFIEALTLHPKMKTPAGGDADNPPQVKQYTPSGEEFNLFTELTKSFIGSLGAAYPKPDDLNEAHKTLCKKAQVLVAASLITTGDESQAISGLVRQMTRHEDLALEAANLVSPDWITDQGQRLDAVMGLVISALENENVEAAKQHFDSRFNEDDGKNVHREASIMAVASELVNRKRGADLADDDVAIAWVADAHNQGIQAALQNYQQGQVPNFDAARKILKVMSTDYEDWALDARGSLNLVNQVTEQTKNWPGHYELLPGMVGVLARHQQDEGCMEKAKSLIQTFIEQVKVQKSPHKIAINGVNVQYRIDDTALALMEVVAPNRKLSAFALQIAQAFMDFQPMNEKAGKLAETVVKMECPPGMKEKLAYLVDNEWLAELPNEQLARMALAWAASPETHHRARDIISQFDTKHRPTEVPALAADVQLAYVRIEGAVRLAVPNLMTEKTANDLFAGFKAPNKLVRQETIEQVGKYMPRDLIAKVLENVDFAEVGQILKQKAAEAAGEKPDEAAAQA